MNEQKTSDDKDLPLRDDIRLLGRVLGDTVRAQEGEAVFDLVETIRQSSIRFRRHEDRAARHELEATLDSLSRDQTIDVVRAFSYFSHLSNIAEDQHHIRRSRAHQIEDRLAFLGAHGVAEEAAEQADIVAEGEIFVVARLLFAHRWILSCRLGLARGKRIKTPC